MKPLYPVFSALMFIILIPHLDAQVRIFPESAPGFEQRIRNHIDTIRVVDTHEHLMNPEGIAESNMCDFTLLLHHYADDDIKSAGMPKAEFDVLISQAISPLEKWKAIRPYWEDSKNTAYNRVVLLTLRKLFGIDRLDETTVEKISEEIRKAYQKDWHHYIFEEKCRFDYIVVDSNDRSFGDPSKFRYVQRFNYLRLASRGDIRRVGENNKMTIITLDDLCAALEKEFDTALQKGFLAVKVGDAYHRSLFFEDVSKEMAEKNFSEIIKSESPLTADRIKPLSDYMMHRIIGLARKHDKPVQIHTGLQAGDGNLIENTNPTLLANLFLQYRDVKFILFHGGYPFGSELASLAKNFQQVYLDLCWLYIISPSYSERYLHEWLETVPANKIMGFGGDYHNAENVYGHLLFAKQVIGNVLVEKVRDGYFSEEEAMETATMILHDNAIAVLKPEY